VGGSITKVILLGTVDKDLRGKQPNLVFKNDSRARGEWFVVGSLRAAVRLAQ
jgi:hypothetical protein